MAGAGTTIRAHTGIHRFGAAMQMPGCGEFGGWIWLRAVRKPAPTLNRLQILALSCYQPDQSCYDHQGNDTSNTQNPKDGY